MDGVVATGEMDEQAPENLRNQSRPSAASPTLGRSRPIAIALAAIIRPTSTRTTFAARQTRCSCEVLLGRRAAGRHLAGLWELPGGKIQPGESAIAAASREAHEELGIDIAKPLPLVSLEHRYSDRTVRLTVIVFRSVSGQPTAGDGVDAWQWVPIDELDRYPMPDANGPIVGCLSRGRLLV